ncbi:hypothetical protein B0T10DRAFT_488860 [Thelonectria olida]|uniref:SWIM-type domain-containing protein n=1 Tax=Thelonectria olida TaxID=1576542 RepID=A0A9P8W639_9HYPO|nr:hypothetical protein B0T10DRAFT_488860 [Thelonectria olida]
MQSLPSHRRLLTSLLNSISEIESQPGNTVTSSTTATPPASSSPLHAIPPSERPPLLTLHVLFPNLLLPALDLLDRGLVQRLCRSKDGSETGDAQPRSIVGRMDGIFLVRSIATTMSRRGRDPALSSQRYAVHLGAWNCSCASFTFDAFPTHAVTAPGQDAATQLDMSWSFGGLSLDGVGSSAGDVPCCKHLLACLLVHKWPSMLGRYVETWSVTKEEMAGIMAEI